MNRIIKEFGVAGILVAVCMAGAMAAAAGTAVDTTAVCGLVVELEKVFQIMRTLAFVGAAFSIAGWAWGYISKGDAGMDDLKKKGTGLLVGFILLFGMGFIFQFLGSTTGHKALGCATFATWGN